MISWELTLGNLLNVGTIIGGTIIFVMSIKGRLDVLNTNLNVIDRRLTAVETSISALSQATVQLAKQEVRLDTLAKEIAELKKTTLDKIANQT